MITTADIYNRLKESLSNSGMTQTALAAKLGIKQVQISRYLSGKQLPALDTLANLCLLLDVSPAYILCFPEISLTNLK